MIEASQILAQFPTYHNIMTLCFTVMIEGSQILAQFPTYHNIMTLCCVCTYGNYIHIIG